MGGWPARLPNTLVISSNRGVKWLPWSSRIRRQCFPVIRPFVAGMKVF